MMLNAGLALKNLSAKDENRQELALFAGTFDAVFDLLFESEMISSEAATKCREYGLQILSYLFLEVGLNECEECLHSWMRVN
jgi:hypothetical protein